MAALEETQKRIKKASVFVFTKTLFILSRIAPIEKFFYTSI